MQRVDSYPMNERLPPERAEAVSFRHAPVVRRSQGGRRPLFWPVTWSVSVRAGFSHARRNCPSAAGRGPQTLIQHDLVDEYQRWLHPVVLGSGKRLFRDGDPRRT